LSHCRVLTDSWRVPNIWVSAKLYIYSWWMLCILCLLCAILDGVGGDSADLVGILLRLLVTDVLELVFCNVLFRLPGS
jgi:hypothetical protein